MIFLYTSCLPGNELVPRLTKNTVSVCLSSISNIHSSFTFTSHCSDCTFVLTTFVLLNFTNSRGGFKCNVKNKLFSFVFHKIRNLSLLPIILKCLVCCRALSVLFTTSPILRLTGSLKWMVIPKIWSCYLTQKYEYFESFSTIFVASVTFWVAAGIAIKIDYSMVSGTKQNDWIFLSVVCNLTKIVEYFESFLTTFVASATLLG